PKGVVDIQLPAAGPRDHAHRLAIDGKPTNPFFLDLDDLPEHLETEPNDQPGQAKPVTVPAMLNGRIDKPGDVDYWALTARKGEALRLDVRARTLGSPLHAVLVLGDASGKELARSDSVAQGLADPSLQFTAPADGTYWVRISEAFPSRGGPDYAYRLRATGNEEHALRLRLADEVLTLNRGGKAKLKVTVERTAAPAPIQLTVDGLPDGVTAPAAQIGANQGSGEITLKADASVPIRASRLTIRG